MFSLSRLPRIWLTVGVAATIVGLLLIGFRSQYPRHDPTFYTPPPNIHETKTHNVDDHGQMPPTGVADTHPAETRPSQHTPPTEQPMASGPQSLEDTRNATLGVREDQTLLDLVPGSNTDVSRQQFEKLLVINFPDRTDSMYFSLLHSLRFPEFLSGQFTH